MLGLDIWVFESASKLRLLNFEKTMLIEEQLSLYSKEEDRGARR